VTASAVTARPARVTTSVTGVEALAWRQYFSAATAQTTTSLFLHMTIARAMSVFMIRIAFLRVTIPNVRVATVAAKVLSQRG
jgi:hypothetical protein